MAKEREEREAREAVRCLEALHKGEERPISSLCTIVHHNVYSCEPGALPVPVDKDQDKKLYYSMNVTDRAMTPSGPSRRTPRGRWKSREGHREIIINGTAHGFTQRFKYISGEPLGENIKWAMIEYTLYPPKAKKNNYALCYVYRTKQDGRQNNRRPQSNVHPVGTSYTAQGCSEPSRISGSNEGGQFENVTRPLQSTDRPLEHDVPMENSPLGFYEVSDDILDLKRWEHSSNDAPDVTLDELGLEYMATNFHTDWEERSSNKSNN